VVVKSNLLFQESKSLWYGTVWSYPRRFLSGMII
jgi:hypothetical protein